MGYFKFTDRVTRFVEQFPNRTAFIVMLLAIAVADFTTYRYLFGIAESVSWPENLTVFAFEILISYYAVLVHLPSYHLDRRHREEINKEYGSVPSIPVWLYVKAYQFFARFSFKFLEKYIAPWFDGL